MAFEYALKFCDDSSNSMKIIFSDKYSYINLRLNAIYITCNNPCFFLAPVQTNLTSSFYIHGAGKQIACCDEIMEIAVSLSLKWW